jgi:hypothetical protein
VYLERAEIRPALEGRLTGEAAGSACNGARLNSTGCNVLMFLRIGQHLKRLSRDASPIATSNQ